MNATDYALIIEGCIGVAVALILCLTVIALAKVNTRKDK